MVLFHSLMVPVLPGTTASEIKPVLAGQQAQLGSDPLCMPGENSASAETSQHGAGVPHPRLICTPPVGLAWRCRARGACDLAVLVRRYAAAKPCMQQPSGQLSAARSHFILPEPMEHEGLHPPGLGIAPLAGSGAGREKRRQERTR